VLQLGLVQDVAGLCTHGSLEELGVRHSFVHRELNGLVVNLCLQWRWGMELLLVTFLGVFLRFSCFLVFLLTNVLVVMPHVCLKVVLKQFSVAVLCRDGII